MYFVVYPLRMVVHCLRTCVVHLCTYKYRTELGGMPPLAVTLKTHEEATAILRRAGVCRGTQLQVDLNYVSLVIFLHEIIVALGEIVNSCECCP